MTVPGDLAELQVRVAFGRSQLQAAVLPVQVRLPSLLVVAVGGTGEPIRVPPGEYVVAVTVPGGAELTRYVVVRSGERLVVELRPEPAEGRYFGAQEEPDGPALVAASQPDLPAADGARRTVYLMLLTGSPLAPPLQPAGAARIEFPQESPDAAGLPWRDLPLLAAPTGTRWHAPDRCELTLLPLAQPDPGRWLRITAPPDRARVVAVPAGPGETCTLLVTLPAGRRSPEVEFHLPDPTVDAFLQYRSASDIGAARAMLAAGTVDRTTSPVTRALLDYAALRWGMEKDEAGPLTDTDLPDTWIVEGERCARNGEHGRAQELFRLALRAGLPLFSDGLGMLSTRVPQYLRLMAADVLEDSATLRDDWARLAPVLRVADLKPVPLTLRADVPFAAPHGP